MERLSNARLLPWQLVFLSQQESYRQRHQSREQSCDGVVISGIPEDVIHTIESCVLRDGLEAAFGKELILKCPARLTALLNGAISNALCELSLLYCEAIENYSGIEGDIFAQMDVIQDNCFFLCSVANDSLWLGELCNPDGASECELGVRCFFVSVSAAASYDALRNSALDQLVNILFRPLQLKYFSNFVEFWLDTNNFFDSVMAALYKSTVVLKSPLKFVCFFELIDLIVDRLLLHYFMFLGEAVQQKRKFSIRESRKLRNDVTIISEYLKSLVIYEGPEFNCSYDDARMTKKLKPLIHASILLESPMSSREYLESKKALEHATIVSENLNSIHLLRSDLVTDVS